MNGRWRRSRLGLRVQAVLSVLFSMSSIADAGYPGARLFSTTSSETQLVDKTLQNSLSAAGNAVRSLQTLARPFCGFPSVSARESARIAIQSDCGRNVCGVPSQSADTFFQMFAACLPLACHCQLPNCHGAGAVRVLESDQSRACNHNSFGKMGAHIVPALLTSCPCQSKLNGCYPPAYNMLPALQYPTQYACQTTTQKGPVRKLQA